MLEVENLSVCYGHINAVTGVSFSIPEHSIISLIGSNGAGKTTTLMAISALRPKTSGTVRFLGEDITRSKPAAIVRKGLCQVPEGRHIFTNLSVEDNLLVGSAGCGGGRKANIQELLEEQYALFPRLKERRTQRGGTLSGGEQQMLAIARALMAKPKLLMLDEPAMGLAPIIIDEIFELLLSLKARGKTILLVEQNANMALSVSDRAYVLELGAITTEGTGAALLESDKIIKAYLG
ncbi:MAG: ABC transporter ATP-binding protein [Spirochaetaceae bacterium]|jgi:branched-chain amino acid transport system ATP-binding protein|nr:ABC transporter ATP-binding protein [Spirochaetaceae bacterium]